MQERTAYNRRAILPVNAVKVEFNESGNAIWPNRGREEDITSVVEHTVCLIETGRSVTSQERNGQLVRMVNDLSGRGGNAASMEEYFENTRFGGISTRDAIDTRTTKDTIYATAKGGSDSVYNTGPHRINMGDDIMYGGPMDDNRMAFQDDPKDPRLTRSDQFSGTTGIAPGKTPIWTIPWKADRAISAKHAYRNGVKRDTPKNKLYHAEVARDKALIKATLTTLAENGWIQLSGDLSQPNAPFRDFNAVFKTPNGVLNSAYTALMQNIDDGLTSGGRRTWRRAQGTGRDPLMDIIQRRKFARTPNDSLFRKSKHRNPKERTLSLRHGSAMGDYYAELGKVFYQSRARVFATAISTADSGQLCDILIKTL